MLGARRGRRAAISPRVLLLVSLAALAGGTSSVFYARPPRGDLEVVGEVPVLGLIYLLACVKVVYARDELHEVWSLREACFTIALAALHPAAALTVLVLVLIQQRWASRAPTERRDNTATVGVLGLLLYLVLFEYVDVLGQVEKFSMRTLRTLIPGALAISALQALISFRLRVNQTILAPLLVAWGAAVAGLVPLAAANVYFDESVAYLGAPLLLVAIIAVTLLRLLQAHCWDGIRRLLERWESTPRNVAEYARLLRKMRPWATSALILEDRAHGAVIWAAASPLRREVRSGRSSGSLREFLSRRTQPGGELWRQELQVRGRLDVDPSEQRVALVHGPPPRSISFTTSIGVPWAGRSLNAEALLTGVSHAAQAWEREATAVVYLTKLLKSVSDGHALVDARGRVLVWSGPLAQVTGIPEQEALGQRLEGLIPSPADSLRARLRVRKIARAGQDVYLHTAATRTRHLGKPAALYTFWNVTTVARLFQGQSQFFAYVAHELQGPISSLVLQTEELEARLGGGDPAVRVLQAVADQLSDHLRDITTAREFYLKRRAVPVEEQVTGEDLLDFPWLRRVLRSEPRVQIVADGEFRTYVDVFRFRQLLTNLVGNALKYSDLDTRVEVRYGSDRQSPYVRVIDRGIGVPDGEAELIFEPNYRGSNTGDIPGRGLGLAYARELARATGGELHHEPNPGGGSVFTLRLRGIS